MSQPDELSEAMIEVSEWIMRAPLHRPRSMHVNESVNRPGTFFVIINWKDDRIDHCAVSGYSSSFETAFLTAYDDLRAHFQKEGM